MRMTTTVDGIPCEAEFFYTPPLRGLRERGTGVPLEPDEPASYEFRGLYDRRGYPAPWLERKLTPDEIRRLEQEAYEHFSS